MLTGFVSERLLLTFVSNGSDQPKVDMTVWHNGRYPDFRCRVEEIVFEGQKLPLAAAYRVARHSPYTSIGNIAVKCAFFRFQMSTLRYFR